MNMLSTHTRAAMTAPLGSCSSSGYTVHTGTVEIQLLKLTFQHFPEKAHVQQVLQQSTM